MEFNENLLHHGYPRKRELTAVILDMDGVVTQTARVHMAAWKEMFRRYTMDSDPVHPPMSDEDYYCYIDGRPRCKGVLSFLESRNIELPFGSADDSPDEKTVCGLGNLKNRIFLDLIEKHGVDTYSLAISQIRRWRSSGFTCAIVTSSRNCEKILTKAGINDLFESRIDGLTLEQRGMKGKPDPEMFYEAARELGVDPGNCVVIEDSISGIQAGCRGNFALVVGVTRSGNSHLLYQNGADIVVDNLKQIDLFSEQVGNLLIKPAPSLFEYLPQFREVMTNKKPVLFLDYDGTLTPIVKNPSDAILSPDMKDVIVRASKRFTVAIISGRDMDDLKSIVGINGLIYGGSHGFRISGPDGLYMEHHKSQEIIAGLDEIEKKLNVIFPGDIEGMLIERKRYAIAVHYRKVDDEKIPLISDKVTGLLEGYPEFRKGGGKKIVEIRPNLDWHKGKAIGWVLNKLQNGAEKESVPIYVGDDLTDEDVFDSLQDSGIGLLVGFHGHETKAGYSLKNVYQVQLFIEMLINDLPSDG